MKPTKYRYSIIAIKNKAASHQKRIRELMWMTIPHSGALNVAKNGLKTLSMIARTVLTFK